MTPILRSRQNITVTQTTYFHVCVCVCVCDCARASMPLCVCACVSCMSGYTLVCLFTSCYVRARVDVRACLRIYLCACEGVCMPVWLPKPRLGKCAWLSVCVLTRGCGRACMHVYLQVSLHMCTNVRLTCMHIRTTVRRLSAMTSSVVLWVSKYSGRSLRSSSLT